MFDPVHQLRGAGPHSGTSSTTVTGCSDASVRAVLQIGPCVAEAISLRPRVIGVEHVLMGARDPRAASDFGDDRGGVPQRGGLRNPAVEFRVDD